MIRQELLQAPPQPVLHLLLRPAGLAQGVQSLAECGEPRTLEVREQLDECAAELPDVDPAIVRGRPPLLRREVVLCAAYAREHVVWPRLEREPEVSLYRAARCVEQEVRGLDVPMHDPIGVQHRQCSELEWATSVSHMCMWGSQKSTYHLRAEEPFVVLREFGLLGAIAGTQQVL